MLDSIGGREILNENSDEIFGQSVCVVDVRSHDMPLVYLNKSFERLTGYTREIMLGRPYSDLFRGNGDVPELWQAFEAIEDRRRFVTDMECLRRSQDRFFCRFAATPLLGKSGTVTHYVFIQEDITLLRVIEETLTQYVQQLN